MREPKNRIMFSDRLTPGDKLVLIGDSVRDGANGYGYYIQGLNHETGTEFAHVAWFDDPLLMDLDERAALLSHYEAGRYTIKSMQVDVALEYLIGEIVKDN